MGRSDRMWFEQSSSTIGPKLIVYQGLKNDLRYTAASDLSPVPWLQKKGLSRETGKDVIM